VKTHRHSKLILLYESLFWNYFLIYNLYFYINPNKILNLKVFIFFKKRILQNFYIIYKNSIKFKSSFYINNLSKSFIYWIFKTTNFFLKYNKIFFIDIFLKNNKIVKIAPNYNNSINSWISDKTRFSFDGMFSPERVLKGFYVNNLDEISYYKNWKNIIKDILASLYFQDHLNRHFFKQRNLTIVFDNTYSIEVVKLLCLLSAKYKFIKLRKSENNLQNNDLETSFLSDQHDNFNELLKNSTKCLLLGFNSRYESSTLNTKLRKRYLQGNFEVFSISSSIDLTFPVSYLNLTTDKLNKITEGNDKFCQTLVNSKTLILTSSSIYNRKDSSSIFESLKFLTSKIQQYNHQFTNIKTINLSINETGIKYLNNFKSFSEHDLKNSSGIKHEET
jgi:hypothetical protein